MLKSPSKITDERKGRAAMVISTARQICCLHCMTVFFCSSFLYDRAYWYRFTMPNCCLPTHPHQCRTRPGIVSAQVISEG